MSHELWTEVDEYICERLLVPDPALEAALAASMAAGLPPIAVTANQGKLLQLLVRMHGSRRGPGARNPRRLQHDLARTRAAR